MQLSELISPVSPEVSLPDVEVSRLVLDSRHVQPGDVFVALQGQQADGSQYISDALKKGAVAVLTDTNHGIQDAKVFAVKNLRQHLGMMAAMLYDHPAKHLRLIGVTGTNGKTSCTHFLAQALTAAGVKTGLIGTLGSGLYGALGEAGMTTPDPLTLQALLSELRHEGAKAVAMEVSSHSIDQQRIGGLQFEVGIFTNLTQDHLDYHGDMASYAAVKYRFLVEASVNHVVLNLDDAYAQRWLPELVKIKSLFAYSTKPLSGLPPTLPCVYTEEATFSLNGIKAKVVTPWGSGQLSLPLTGEFNLSNALAVLTALCIYGIPLEKVLVLLSQLEPVPGRMQTLGGHGKPLVVVDYAHTPDALENALKSLKQHLQGKLICVFGCGGDRDPGKRPQMAAIAENLANTVVVTNDNPRHEAPEAIAREICKGFKQADKVHIELDRSKAIQKSIQLATDADCILIAGKGAECYQQIGDTKYPFEDIEVVKQYL